MKKIIECKKVSVDFDGVKALNDVNFSIFENEIIAFVGPNGSGKSTLFKTLFGLLSVSSGEIFIYKQPLQSFSHSMIQNSVVFIPQGRRIFENLTVFENLEMGGFFIKNKKEVYKRIYSLFQDFPILEKKQNKKAKTLSGGQKQILSLARGLISNPKILLLDEPSLGLSQKTLQDFLKQLKKLHTKNKTTILIIEHQLDPFIPLIDRVYTLNKGEISSTRL